MPEPGFVHPLSPEGWQDPYPSYAWLAAHAPVHDDPASGAVLITSHADCDALLRHRDASTAQQDRNLPPSMLTTDPPEHTRLRAVGARLISAASVERMRPAVERHVADQLAACATDFEAYEDVGIPLSLRVLAELLDVPATEFGAFAPLALTAAVNIEPVAAGAAGRRAAAALAFYLRTRLVVSDRLRAWVDEAGCTEAEAVGVLSLSIIGGVEPVAAVCAAALVELASSGSADVEDVLRRHTPIPFVARNARADITLPHGVVPAGRRALVMLDAANRDPATGKHLSFGAGPHFCLGAPLVRLVVTALLDGWRRAGVVLELVDEPRAWSTTFVPRRLQPLHLRGRRGA